MAARKIRDLVRETGKGLALEGGITNLTPAATPLEIRMKKTAGGSLAYDTQAADSAPEAVYPEFQPRGRAYIEWVPQETIDNHRHKAAHENHGAAAKPEYELAREDLVEVKDHHLELGTTDEVIGTIMDTTGEIVGTINSVFNLVEAKPEEVQALLKFWRKTRSTQYARTVGLPKPQPEYQFYLERKDYYVVSRGVAILAYLEGYAGLKYLLVPTMPKKLPDGTTVYQALVSMQQVQEDLEALATEDVGNDSAQN